MRWSRKTIICLVVSTMLAVFMIGCGNLLQEASEQERKNPDFNENITFSVEHPMEENIAGIIQENAAPTMVHINCGNAQGSGVIWQMDAEYVTVVTAAHVVEGAEWVKLLFSDGFLVECKDIIISESADLSFLRMETKLFLTENLSYYRYAATDKQLFDALAEGDGIVIMGSVGEIASNAYEGILLETWIYMEDFQQYMMLGKTYAIPGMSGGGVFDQNGHFIGILCGGNENNEIAVLPLSIIISEYTLLSDIFI